jgi:ribosomal protein S18 acetylase RimI-like enzyme
MAVTLDEVTGETIVILRPLHQDNFDEEMGTEVHDEIACQTTRFALLAKFDGPSVGEIWAEWRRGCDRDMLYISSLNVSAPYRGCGIGRLLLDEVMVRYPAATVVFLHVRITNEPAKRLYNRHGFTFVKQCPGDYGDEDALLLLTRNPAHRSDYWEWEDVSDESDLD